MPSLRRPLFLLKQTFGLLPLSALDRDRGTPRDATPPTPPGIRVPYHGGSTELGLGGRIDLGKSERLEIVVAYGLLDRRVSGHAPEPGW
jgi:hypothetical protein